MCYKESVRDRKIIVFLVAGIVFVAIGFVLNFSFNIASKENGLGSQNYKKDYKSLSREQQGISEVLSQNSSNGVKQEVEVAKVLDGDTIETNFGAQIRYIGINSPEMGEPFFGEALELNESLVLDKNVGLEFDIKNLDRYGRTLAYVFVGEELINLEMARNGLAVVQTIQPNVKYQDAIVAAQREARDKCLGIWVGLCKDKTRSQESSSRCIEISFINHDASGNDNENKNGEWVEISNTCSIVVALDGWTLKDSSASNRYQFKEFALDGNKSVVIYSGCGQDSASMLYWKCPEGKYAVWNNTGDQAFLYNEEGELVSNYSY